MARARAASRTAAPTTTETRRTATEAALLLPLLTLLALSLACSGAAGPPDRRPDVSPAPESAPPLAQRQRRRSNHEMLELAEEIPGFGGLYLSYPGFSASERPRSRSDFPHGGSPIAINVYLTASGDSAHARRVLTRRFEAQGRSVVEVRIVPAKYTFGQLERWLRQITPAVSHLEPTVWSASGGSNKVWIGFATEAGAARARDVIRDLGIPLDAVRIDVMRVVTPQ